MNRINHAEHNQGACDVQQFDMGDLILREIDISELSTVERIVEVALQNTFEASHGGQAMPGRDGQHPVRQRDFFGDNGVVFKILVGQDIIGGIFIRFDRAERRGVVELFGLSAAYHGKGFGQRIWRKIEQIYQDVRVWELQSPTFALRNVAFYVNKCGFHIVAITRDQQTETWDMFRFEKISPSERRGGGRT
ncbi:GNAT family N-acetyltransferase [Tardiphaga robiniae]|nr:GNAT family N-acetyltransferase [Tardiphaga robiniae]